LETCPTLSNKIALGKYVDDLDGHFAFVLSSPNGTLAAVDPIASYPLFYDIGFMRISDRAVSAASPDRVLNSDQLQAFAMGGFTVGCGSLYDGVRQLLPGELLSVDPNGEAALSQYGDWLPGNDKIDEREPDLSAEQGYRSQLASLTLSLLERLIGSVGDRTIVVPLSAGMDSRLIVSGLHQLGAQRVKCFSYGKIGNHESEAGRDIAEHLGYEWRFVPYSVESQRNFFSSQIWNEFMERADTGAAMPFQQDLPALVALKRDGWLPEDSVVVNGQSGDFIAGNHITPGLRSPEVGLETDADAVWPGLFREILKKHGSMWRSLLTPENERELERLYRADAASEPSTQRAYGRYERLEFRNRQSKYVIGGQRVYDFLDLDWRMPLWDRGYLNFWQDAPLWAKSGRFLFATTMSSENWGGVWGDDWSYPQTVVPSALRLGRLALRVPFALLGRHRWHDFERRFLAYEMDTLCNYAIESRGTVWWDRQGHRNALAWHLRRYLEGKNVELKGSVASPIVGQA